MGVGIFSKTEYDQRRYNYPSAIYESNEVRKGITTKPDWRAVYAGN